MNGREPELWRAVTTLPAKQRAAVLLRFAGDLAYREIGEATGSSEEAARRNMRVIAGLTGIDRNAPADFIDTPENFYRDSKRLIAQ